MAIELWVHFVHNGESVYSRYLHSAPAVGTYIIVDTAAQAAVHFVVQAVRWQLSQAEGIEDSPNVTVSLRPARPGEWDAMTAGEPHA